MSLNKYDVKTILVTLTIILLGIYATSSHLSRNENIAVIQKEQQLNSLRGNILYLDEALTMSARTYVLTQDKEWYYRYKRKAVDFDLSINQLYSLLPRPFEGEAELKSSIQNLFALEARSFDLARSNQYAQATSVLFGKEYRHEHDVYKSALIKLTNELNLVLQDLTARHQRQALETTIVTILIAIFLIVGWYWFLRTSKTWQEEVNKANVRQAREATAAAQKLERLNQQLRLLSIHHEDVREKERLKIAYEINEELGQRLAAHKMKIASIQDSITSNDFPQAAALQQLAVQMDEALDFLSNIVHGIYPLVLRDLGLVEALDWYSQKMTSKMVTVHFYSELNNLQLDLKTSSVIFRSYQERLEDLVNFGATEILSFLTVENKQLLFKIYDNLKLCVTDDTRSIKEVAIQERIFTINGNIKFECSEEEGNTCIISIPYQPQTFDTGALMLQ